MTHGRKSLISSIDLTLILGNLNSDLIVSWNIDLLVTATCLSVVLFNFWELYKRKYIRIVPSREILKNDYWSCKHIERSVRSLRWVVASGHSNEFSSPSFSTQLLTSFFVTEWRIHQGNKCCWFLSDPFCYFIWK